MILVIDTSRKNASVITDILWYMGFLAYPANPQKGLKEISNIYTAILISNPIKFPDIKDYVKRIKSYDSNMMIFSISDGENPFPELFDLNFRNNIYSSTLAREMVAYSIKRAYRIIGEYKAWEISANYGDNMVIYEGKEIPFTKMEMRVIRFLLRTHPAPQMTDRIIKYIYPKSKRPEHSGLRTHISHINTKFRAVTGKNLIEMKPKEGYTILVTRDFLDYIRDYTTTHI